MESSESDEVGAAPRPSSAYPAAPPVRVEEEPVAPRPPLSLTLSFWGWILSAVVWVVGGIMFLGAKSTIISAMRQSNNQLRTGPLTDSQIQQAANTAVITALVFAIVVAALYTLFAFKLRAGRNWARIVLTVIAVLALLDLLVQAHAGNALSMVGAVVAIVAAVLSYLPASNAYIAASKRARLR